VNRFDVELNAENFDKMQKYLTNQLKWDPTDIYACSLLMAVGVEPEKQALQFAKMALEPESVSGRVDFVG